MSVSASALRLIMRLVGGEAEGGGGSEGRTVKRGGRTCWVVGCLTPLAWKILLRRGQNAAATEHTEIGATAAVLHPAVRAHLEDGRQYWGRYRSTRRTHRRESAGNHEMILARV